jgi:tripartite-type tricarboxylate transporter receptor subunit TctC
VPFAPGGTSEIVARTVANELTKQLGQTVFVDNKGGGAGVPAMTEVAKAAPDGHTMILGHVGSLAVNPYIFNNQPYDVNRDFLPVTMLAQGAQPVRHPPRRAGEGLQGVRRSRQEEPRQAELRHGGQCQRRPPGDGVPEAGDRDVHDAHPLPRHRPDADRPAGRAHAGHLGRAAGADPAHQERQAARDRGGHRAAPAGMLPDVPTVAEMGYKDFETSQWYGILVPAGTPREIVKRLQEESLKALKSNSVTERFASDGAFGGGGPPEEFAAFIAGQQKTWSAIIKRAAIKPD